MRFIAVMACAVLLICLGVAPGHAEKRLALLIGNQAYNAEVGPLGNPHNDVALMEKTLKGLGFEVTAIKDAGFAALNEALNAYLRRVKAAGPDAISFFYYSGHGASDGTTDYLIPVDVASADAGKLWDQSVRVTEITSKLRAEANNATHFVVFDACRNALKVKKPGTRALVQAEGFKPVREESGMLIAFATAEGELASDLGEGAGPYSRALAEEIVKPGVEAVTMFRRVQLRLRAAIGQEPWLGFGALGEVYLAGLAPTEPPKPPPGPAPAAQGDPAAQAWAELKDSKNQAELEEFVTRFGDSSQASLARARLDELKKLAAVVKPVAPSLPPGPCGAAAQTVSLATRAARPLSDVEACVLKPKDVFRECDKCPDMVVVPPGSFTMGSPPNEAGRAVDEGPEHLVTLAKPFAVGVFAVTFDQWEACVADGGCNGYNPADGSFGRGRLPVINVSWNDAQAYAAWLSKKTGKIYRLLSEAEREYVTRAGKPTLFWSGASITAKEANYDGTNRKTLPADAFVPNPFGLYQVHGNVWEWVADCYHENYAGAPSDGSAWSSADCSRRVLRGGSWRDSARFLRSAARQRYNPDYRDNDHGFRLARPL
ncbi:MAG: SUMF1/EgtB/PvdO family nonheme iron enzyme [Xanthobacteraceae bacterium]